MQFISYTSRGAQCDAICRQLMAQARADALAADAAYEQRQAALRNATFANSSPFCLGGDMCSDPRLAEILAICQAGDVGSCEELAASSGYSFSWSLGYGSDLGTPQQVMDFFKHHAASVFPFSIGSSNNTQR
jgi:hypothetical protein